MSKTFTTLLVGSSLAGSPAFAATVIPPILTGAPTAAEINKRCEWFVTESTKQAHCARSIEGCGHGSDHAFRI